MKKLLLLLYALLIGVSGVWAETGTITIASAADEKWPNGTYYNGSSTSASWGSVWISSADGEHPQVKVTNTTDIAYLNTANGRIATTEFYLEIQPGYKITGWTLEFAGCASTAATVTAANGSSKESSGSSDYRTLTVSDLSCLSTSFTVSGDYIIVKNFQVNYEDAPTAYYAIKNAHSDFANYAYFYQGSGTTSNFNKGGTDLHVTNANYVWQAPNDGGYLTLKNAGTGEYVPKFVEETGGTCLTMTSISTDAETFSIVPTTCSRSYQTLKGQFTLNSRTKTASFLDAYSSTSNIVACHYNQGHKGDVTVFTELKKVTFSQSVTVNGDAVTAIYVATDGSDASNLSLPSDKVYSLDGGDTWLSNTVAVDNITAAGISDLTVTVVNAVSVTYNLIWDDPEAPIHTQAGVSVPVGYAPSKNVPWTVPAYCSFTYDVATIAEETTEVNVTLNWNGPFDFSTDYEHAVWYFVNIGGSCIYYNTGNSVSLLSSWEDAFEKGDKALWTFVGNPMGFQMYNKDAGSDMYLLPATKIEMWNKNSSYDAMSYYTLGEKEGGAYLIFYDSNQGADYYFRRYENKNDVEPQVTNVATDNEVTTNFRSYYCQKGLDAFADYVGDAINKNLGVKSSSVDQINGIISSRMSKMTEEEFNTYCSDFKTSALAGYIVFIYPPTGYYRIKNNGTGKYIAYGQSTDQYGGNREIGLITISAAETATNASTIIKLTASSANPIRTTTYKISTEGLNVQSQEGGNKAFPATTDSGVDFTFTIQSPGVASITNADSYADSNKDGSLHAATDEWGVGAVVNWSASAANSQWLLEDAETLDLSLNGPVGGNYYATLCVPFDVTLPTGTSAYTLTLNDAETALTMSDALSEVPAGTPVLLKGSSASATVDIGTGYAASPLTTTSLTGTYVSKSVTGGTDYFLGNYEGTVGFYHWAGSTLVANRAYFEASKLSGGGEVKGFGLEMDDTTVGLSSVPEPLQQENGSVYNLSGQRVAKPVRGLYIVNGKKVVVK